MGCRRLLSVLALVFLAACSKTNQNEIVIGEFSSLTGNTASFGIASHNGFAMATEERNANGGVLGKQIKLVTEDDQGKSEEARSSVLKLIRYHKAKALLGEFASSRSIAAAPEAQKFHVPMVSHGSTNPKVTEFGDYIFRTCFIDPFQGKAMAKFAYNTLGIRRAAILRDVKNDYSVGLAKYFQETFQALDGTIVADESYSEGDVEFRSQLTAMKALKPQAVFIPGYYTEVGLIARQARELGIDVPLLGGDGWDSPKTAEIGGKAIDGSYFSNHYAQDDPDPKVQNFIKKYKAKYGSVPDSQAVLAYDAANLLFDAIQRAGSTDGDKIRAALAATNGFPGITGSITIDPNRNAQKSLVIVQYSNGKPIFKDRVGS
ncbi:MAG: ethanolamine utilization protein EutJ [Deltaproteobacteria bacterium CG11_big_fil_rev_8_21_14_0_20_47_16]|nr:MAG: ethanolamine utilization protein EutJ [Deltaproteobacteria bacterium CG11_big_fil_rev_8_21_14_0_20_47_16]